jgi:hypothetical protein
MYGMPGLTFDVRKSIEGFLKRIEEGRENHRNTESIRRKFERTYRTRDKAHQRAMDLMPLISSSDEPQKSELQSKYERKMTQWSRLSKKADEQAPLVNRTLKFVLPFQRDILQFVQRLPLQAKWQKYRREIENLAIGNHGCWAENPSDSAIDVLEMRLREMLALAPGMHHKRVEGVSPFPTPAGALWKDVTITFTSDHRVDITVFEIRDARNYAEMGFEDRRGGGKPDSAWACLILLAKGAGKIERPANLERPGWTKLEKKIQHTRARLRKVFGIVGDPLQFSKDVGYEAQFKIVLGPSFKH